MDDKKPIAIIAVAHRRVSGRRRRWWMSRRRGRAKRHAGSGDGHRRADRQAAAAAGEPAAARSDGRFLRPLLGASSRPELATRSPPMIWSQLAAAIDQASRARRRPAISRSSAHVAVRAGGRGAPTIDPASYRRYDGLVATVTSIDASQSRKIYKTIQPRLNEPYRSMGHPEGNVDARCSASTSCSTRGRGGSDCTDRRQGRRLGFCG